MTDTARIAANLVFAAAQPFAGQVSRLTGKGVPIDRRRETYTPATPIAPAFAIWGPLFISELRYAIRAALPKHRDSPLLADIGWLTAIAFAANAAWELQAELDGFDWQSNVIIAVGAGAASTAIVNAERGDYDEGDRDLVRFPIGTLAGWLTVANAANAEASRVALLGRPGARRGEAESIGLIFAASAVAVGVTGAARGSLHYAGGAAWGLAGVALRNIKDARPKVAVAAALGIGAVAAAALWARRRG